MDHAAFFREWAHVDVASLGSDWTHRTITIETLFQAFKARLLDELAGHDAPPTKEALRALLGLDDEALLRALNDEDAVEGTA